MKLWDLFHPVSFWKKTHPIYPFQEVDLRYQYKEKNDGITFYVYDILQSNTNHKVGEIDIRIGDNPDLFYMGHIGYHILKPYRGHHYAYYACLGMFQIAKNLYQLEDIWITCSIGNEASRKTLMMLSGTYLGCYEIPEGHWLRSQNVKYKQVFRYVLKELV